MERTTLVIADDFTGAMDSGVKFLTSGIVRVIPQLGELPVPTDAGAIWGDASTLVVDTETRNLDLADVTARLALACELASVDPEPLVFKKVDSTLRGSIGVEIEQIMATMGATLVCLAPASPEQGRVVRDGVCYHRGVPLAESEIATDTIRPVRSSVVAELIDGQLSRPTASVPLRVVRAGVGDLASALRDSKARGAQVVILDAETDHDLATIARAFAGIDERVLFAGSAGLAKAVAALSEGTVGGTTNTIEVRPFSGESLVVSGSVMPTTAGQLRVLHQEYPDTATVVFSGSAVAGDPEGETRRLRELCESSFVSGTPFAWSPWVLSTDPSDIAADAGTEIAAVLADLVAEIVVERDITTLILTGGDTAHHVIRELEVGSVSLLGELSAGIVVGSGRSGKAKRDLRLITKGGGFGSPDALVSVMRFLEAEGVVEQ